MRFTFLRASEKGPKFPSPLFCSSLHTLRDPSGDEIPLGGEGGEVAGLAEMGKRHSGVAEFRSKRAADGVIEVIGLERAAVRDGGERIPSGLGSVDPRDGDGAIHGRDGRGVVRHELIVKREDARPIRGRLVRCGAVAEQVLIQR